MLLNNIRKSFLDYFEKNEHKVLDSYSLIANNDPSLHFVNAGMVPFKNQFIGKSIYNQSVFKTNKENIIGKIMDVNINGVTTFALSAN